MMMDSSHLPTKPNFPVVDDKGRTALMLAAAKNELENVRELIAGCDPQALPALLNQVDIIGHTALMHAAFSASPLVVQELIYAGANMKLRNPRGHTAYSIACCWENVQVFDLLKKYENSNETAAYVNVGNPSAGYGCIGGKKTSSPTSPNEFGLNPSQVYVPTADAVKGFRSSVVKNPVEFNSQVGKKSSLNGFW
jgi:hypothetical protein